MILTLARTARLLPSAVKEKSVQLLGVQIPFMVQPCMRLARLKFELTNQHSAGGKNFSVLTS